MPEPQETERAIGGADLIGSRILPTGLLYARTFFAYAKAGGQSLWNAMAVLIVVANPRLEEPLAQ